MSRRFAHDPGGGAPVTACAAGRDPRVVILATTGDEPCDAHLVTTIARLRRHQVVRWLSSGLDSVMTGRTGAPRDSNVLEGHAGPAHGPMAIVTRYGCRNMRGGFALHGDIVMTGRTGTRCHPVMGKERRFPICRPVAAVAVDRGRQVVRRLKCRYDSSAGRMALHTLRGGPPIDALKVTALTIDLGMAAAERETGAAMIDFYVRATASLGERGIRHQQHRAADSQKSGNDRPGKEVMSCPPSQVNHSRIRRGAARLCYAISIWDYTPNSFTRNPNTHYWEHNPKHRQSKGRTLTRKTPQAFDLSGKRIFRMGNLPMRRETIPYETAGQHLHDLQMGFISHRS